MTTKYTDFVTYSKEEVSRINAECRQAADVSTDKQTLLNLCHHPNMVVKYSALSNSAISEEEYNNFVDADTNLDFWHVYIAIKRSSANLILNISKVVEQKYADTKDKTGRDTYIENLLRHPNLTEEAYLNLTTFILNNSQFQDRVARDLRAPVALLDALSSNFELVDELVHNPNTSVTALTKIADKLQYHMQCKPNALLKELCRDVVKHPNSNATINGIIGTYYKTINSCKALYTVCTYVQFSKG